MLGPAPQLRVLYQPAKFAVLSIIAKTTTASSSTRMVIQTEAASLRRKIMSYLRPRPEDKAPANAKFAASCSSIDATNAGQMLDHLLGRLAR
jgi:hypothetical protein